MINGSLQKQFCEQLGFKLPLIQAPMAGVQGSALAIAVRRTGALGSLPCAMLSAQQITDEIEKIRAADPSAPYNLNFFCHQPPAEDEHLNRALDNWKHTLAPYYAQYGIDPSSIAAGAGRAPFSEALCDLIAPFRPPVVSFHFGLPEARLVARIKSWGGCVLSSATTVAEAIWLEQNGADAIIAQGLEAGGHRGMFLLQDELKNAASKPNPGLSARFPKDWSQEIQTQQGLMSLLPQIVQSVRLPVIAAGGICSAATVQAAFNLGASAVQVGTAFMLCDEASTSALHRAALQRSAKHPELHHTELTTLFTGRPARGIQNDFMRSLGSLNANSPPFPHATAAVAPLRSQAEAQGSAAFSPLWSGQNASACKSIPAADMVAELIPI